MVSLATQFQDLGDVKVAYRENGAGPALIFLHGNSGSKSEFTGYQLKHFADFHTFAVDSRGHGETISTDERYSIRQYSEDVIRFCRAKGITQANVIGYSDGGNIALFLANQAPQLFPKVVAISPNYLVSGTVDWALRMMRWTSNVFIFLGKLGLSTHKAVSRIDLMLTDIGITDAELACIQTSLHLVYAEHDLIKEDHILQIGRLVPGSTVTKIMGCNHLTIIAKPEAIADMRAYLFA